jgi:hypothetical protein
MTIKKAPNQRLYLSVMKGYISIFKGCDITMQPQHAKSCLTLNLIGSYLEKMQA